MTESYGRVLTSNDYASIMIMINGLRLENDSLRQNIANLQQRVETQNTTIEALTMQIRPRDQISDDESDLPAPPSPRSTPSQAPGHLSSPSSPTPRDLPSSPSPARGRSPAIPQSQFLTSLVNKTIDEENSRSIVLSGVGLMEVLNTRLNNQHEILGQFVPTIKRALSILGLEEISLMATGYKLYRSGALKIKYAEQIEARRSMHLLRSIIGHVKKSVREWHPNTPDSELEALDEKFRRAKSIKFSIALSGRFNEHRKVFQKCAQTLKRNGVIASWDCILIKNSLVMKTYDKRKRRKFYNLEDAATINNNERGQVTEAREE